MRDFLEFSYYCCHKIHPLFSVCCLPDYYRAIITKISLFLLLMFVSNVFWGKN